MTLANLTGKKALFFSPAFFGYENNIVSNLQKLGIEVDYYDVRSVKSAFSRAILKVLPSLFDYHSLKYYEQIIEKNKSEEYDYVIIIKGDMTPVSTLKKMRNRYRNAKFILYLWDSINNIPGIEEKFSYFDRVLTFDLNDARQHDNFIFRPLFYTGDYVGNFTKNFKYDLAFLGTMHSDRYKILQKIDRFAKENDLSTYYFCYLQSQFIYYFYKLTKIEYFKAKKSFFSFEKMSSVLISNIILNSNVIIDIEHPNQSGLTMRTIEMIGMQKKLLTTNKRIKEYDFYNEENIYVIDRNDIKLDRSFFNKSYIPIDQTIYNKYSIEQWVLDVLGENDA